MSVQNSLADQNLSALHMIVCKMVTGTEQVTNSSTFADSTALQIYLEPGLYSFETSTVVASSAYATAGSKEALVFTGTATFSGMWYRDTVANNSGTGGVLSLTTALVSANYDIATATLLSNRKGIVTVTVAGTLKIQFAQSVAIASQNVTLRVGSFMKVERVLS